MGSLLETSYSDWKFTSSQTNLSGTLDVEYYYACAQELDCGKEFGEQNNRNDGFGSAFRIDYDLGEGDPDINNLHWIQRAFYEEPGPIVVNEIDFPESSNQDSPYYDVAGNAEGGDYFVDRPYRFGGSALLTEGEYDWNAELYIVEETGDKQVTIYNGIKWGWQTSVFDPPPDPNPCPGGSGGGGCISRTDALSANSASVPGPTSTLGLIALGLWSMVQRSRNSKNN